MDWREERLASVIDYKTVARLSSDLHREIWVELPYFKLNGLTTMFTPLYFTR